MKEDSPISNSSQSLCRKTLFLVKFLDVKGVQKKLPLAGCNDVGSTEFSRRTRETREAEIDKILNTESWFYFGLFGFGLTATEDSRPRFTHLHFCHFCDLIFPGMQHPGGEHNFAILTQVQISATIFKSFVCGVPYFAELGFVG